MPASSVELPVRPSPSAGASRVVRAPSAGRPPVVDRRPERPAKLFRGSTRTNRLTGVRVVGTGSHVPARVVTNEHLEAEYGFEPGWIERRSGIRERRHATADTATSDLAAAAARKAIDAAGVDPAEVDLVVVGTFTPDQYCPSTACLVQDRLGLDAAAFDVQAACSGFVYALSTAAQYVATGNAKYALAVGADVNSRIVDPREMKVAPLFGDGAGAVLLAAGGANQGFLRYQLGADGEGGPLLEMPAGGTRRPLTPEAVACGDHFLRMDGRTVFKWAVEAIGRTIELVLDREGLRPDEVDLYLLHQANARILDHAAQKLGLPADKVLNNLSRYGNTSAASIPLCLDDAVRTGRVAPGATLLMCGFGAGLTWGTGIWRW